MLTDPVLQWPFTLVFSAVAVYLAFRVLTARGGALLRVSHLLHLAMALVMIAMSWPVWNSLPWRLQLVFFMAATLWFVVLALLRVVRVLPAATGRHRHLWHELCHAVMMGAMTWMVWAMPPGDDSHAHHLDMGHMAGLTEVQRTAGEVLVVALLAALFVELVLLFREKPRSLDPVATVLMLVGMAGMCWVMLTM